ncbi:tRNA pseudouridine(54/55) synthase Pus10 [Haladaptatus sp. GCM10025707]|uniref:tRNA pseudouridine(54/55) synthase Pus10 n=1 Tax=unclassified Haladaptatus TaxID=2622732 RepID=UPI0023E8AA21|nr:MULTISPECIES: tRNA pseudouridine(54/55) synthase Pus10 [unclassified Haladaptatus]
MTILDDARAVIENGPVCDSCLGRVFADRSFGLTNDQRGNALRTAVALAADEPYEPTAVSECWVCEGLCATFDEWAERAAETVAGIEFDTYQVGTHTPPLIEENELLLRESAGLPEDAGEQFKSEFNREVGKRIGRLTETEVDFGRPHVMFTLDLEGDAVEMRNHSTFVYGRYRKLERDIPQTKWPCSECNETGYIRGDPCHVCAGSGYRYPESVEQLAAPPLLAAMEGEETTFHGAGREDVDALMLGTGRPFVMEISNPKVRHVDMAALEAEINEQADGKIEVEGLRACTYEMVERVKEHDASKTYRMDVKFAHPVTVEDLQAAISKLEGATIEQYTPKRVDHRRANLTRERTVYDIEGELVDEYHADLTIHGAGGLYIKELVSGDDGRTEPSLTELLGVNAVVTALDVVAVEGEDEPFEREEFFLD